MKLMNGYVIGAAIVLVVAAQAARAETAAAGRWMDPRCTPLDLSQYGPFLRNADGSLLVVDHDALRTSMDDGKTWSQPGPPIAPGMNLSWGGHVGQLLRTRQGALIIAYLDFAEYRFSWDNDKGAPNPDCKLELWVIRSLDNGMTWVDKQRLLDGYNADFMGFIQTRGGRLVLTVEHLVPELRRWVSLSFVSDDEGQTWKPSNWIDLGGHGHHDGAVEPMVAELSDGRLLMLLRTSLDRFWSAYSEDQGRYWRVIQPTAIDASSSPGWLQRLESGRLVLVWNRLNPQGKTWPKSTSPGPAFELPASWHREELSIAFSGDDAKTWSEPVVIARQPGGSLAYPYVFERQPGELWVFTHFAFDAQQKPAPPLAVRLFEKDFGSPVRPGGR
jgi:hypothetical protein